jgi:hypothetical protein
MGRGLRAGAAARETPSAHRQRRLEGVPMRIEVVDDGKLTGDTEEELSPPNSPTAS